MKINIPVTQKVIDRLLQSNNALELIDEIVVLGLEDTLDLLKSSESNSDEPKELEKDVQALERVISMYKVEVKT